MSRRAGLAVPVSGVRVGAEAPLNLFRAIETRRPFEEAIEQITYAIRMGRLLPGMKLPPERALATTMRVSRQSLRAALQTLGEAGVVGVAPGRGGRAVVLRDSVPAALLARRVGAKVARIGAMLEARRVIEPQVAQLAAIHATPEDFAALTACVEEHGRHLSDRTKLLDLDERFHVLLTASAHNVVLSEIMGRIFSELSVAWDTDDRFPDDGEVGFRLHVETLAAVKSREPSRIADAMDEHLRLVEGLWEQDAGRPRLRQVPIPAPTPTTTSKRRA